MLAKTHAAEDLDVLSDALRDAPLAEARAFPVEIIPSLESARAMWNLRDIAAWKSKHEPRLGGELKALMVCPPPFVRVLLVCSSIHTSLLVKIVSWSNEGLHPPTLAHVL